MPAWRVRARPATAVAGGIGYGLLGDILAGMVGAALGGWIFGTPAAAPGLRPSVLKSGM